MSLILLCINLDIYSSGPLDIQRARIPNSVSPHATLDIGNDRYKFVTILVFKVSNSLQQHRRHNASSVEGIRHNAKCLTFYVWKKICISG